ncbi:hypothetical protein AB0M47_35285 [Hamadaea sp. NPDC051192]|uniref:hypothetical protein n=1 Tax=Hamadaea sp. NPDC051192 TaxID=3154940 RepID=UPI0034456400
MTERLPHWLRGVLSLEAAYRWRALATEGSDQVVSGGTALAVQLRHRVCHEIVCVPAGSLLREPVTVAGMAVASADDVLVQLLWADAAERLADLRQVELRTPLQVEEGLILLAHVRPEVSTERVISELSEAAAGLSGDVGEYWAERLPEVAASMAVRGFVRRAVVPRQRGPVHRPALTLGSSGQVWVEPHERDGQQVAGYWRRR